MQTPFISYKRHRFLSLIIAHAVRLYFRFNLSLREVEEMMLERGIVAELCAERIHLVNPVG